MKEKEILKQRNTIASTEKIDYPVTPKEAYRVRSSHVVYNQGKSYTKVYEQKSK